MRIFASFLIVTASAFAQNLTEFGAVAAGSTVGGASGKSVSNGITAIFGKVDQQAAKAAGKEPKRDPEPEVAVLKVAPGVPSADTGGVPLPPVAPIKRSAPSLPTAQFIAPPEATQFRSLADVAPALPPPPVMSIEDYRTVSKGMTRAEVLRFGAPAAKLTMFEDGHLVEVYSYYQKGQKFGSLRLTDGAVSTIQ